MRFSCILLSVAFILLSLTACAQQTAVPTLDHSATSAAATLPTATSSPLPPTPTASPVPPTLAPTLVPATPTVSLPGAAGTAVITTSAAAPVLKDLFMTDERGEKVMPAAFASGRKSLSLAFRLTSPLVAGTPIKLQLVDDLALTIDMNGKPIEVRIVGNSGPVKLKKLDATAGTVPSPKATPATGTPVLDQSHQLIGVIIGAVLFVPTPEYGGIFYLSLIPASGAFPDGPYQTEVKIAGEAAAQLNWTIGGSK